MANTPTSTTKTPRTRVIPDRVALTWMLIAPNNSRAARADYAVVRSARAGMGWPGGVRVVARWGAHIYSAQLSP
ncbi:hypothetical protein GCM10009744_44400 [Kribbella alba]|uniref:Uncharacterized protein n=1 Tax=Kribbella alba TaxID=190197 RepID=A0ABN2FI71_9ACTN